MRAGSKSGLEVVNDIFKLLLCHAARTAIDYLALGIHDNGRRDGTNPVERRCLALCIKQNRQLHAAVGEEFLYRRSFFLQVHRIEIHLILMRGIERGDVRNLCLTGRTPCRPEIDDVGLSVRLDGDILAR